MQFVRKSAKELIDKSTEDTSQLQAQLIELTTMWDRTCRLSVSKQERLEQAHKLAEEFNKKAHGLLDWLGDAERQLRYRGPIPDEEPLILQQIEEHKVTCTQEFNVFCYQITWQVFFKIIFIVNVCISDVLSCQIIKNIKSISDTQICNDRQVLFLDTSEYKVCL